MDTNSEQLAHKHQDFLRYNSSMQTLPVTQVLPDIKARLSEYNRLILQAPPGAGKTTLVPIAL